MGGVSIGSIRPTMWGEHRKICRRWMLSWVIGSGFNVVGYKEERKGGDTYDRERNRFNGLIQELQLMELQ